MSPKVPSGRRLIRLFVLLAVLSMGGRFLRGSAPRGALTIPGVDGTLLLAAVVGVVVIGGVFVLRAGVPTRGSADRTGMDGDEYLCRYCGENLERYRNRCPRCETRDPVGYHEE